VGSASIISYQVFVVAEHAGEHIGALAVYDVGAALQDYLMKHKSVSLNLLHYIMQDYLMKHKSVSLNLLHYIMQDYLMTHKSVSLNLLHYIMQDYLTSHISDSLNLKCKYILYNYITRSQNG
jgi:hypothetical protein